MPQNNTTYKLVADGEAPLNTSVKRHTLTKSERMCSKKQIEALFTGGQSKSVAVFPIRAVFTITDNTDDINRQPVAIMTSVSKRHFRHAVDRNRVKRQLREAYRKNKKTLYEQAASQGKMIDIAFLWLDNRHHSSQEIESKMTNLLLRIKDIIG